VAPTIVAGHLAGADSGGSQWRRFPPLTPTLRSAASCQRRLRAQNIITAAIAKISVITSSAAVV
jgi:hypothetical protein